MTSAQPAATGPVAGRPVGTAVPATAVPSAGLIDIVALLLLCAAAAFSALLDLMLVPLYAGATLVPVAAALAVVGNVVLPRIAHVLVPSGLATAAPFVVWLVVVFAVGLTARPEGDVILPGGGGAVQWNGYAVVFGGAVAGVLTIVSLLPLRAQRGQRTQRTQRRPQR